MKTREDGQLTLATHPQVTKMADYVTSWLVSLLLGFLNYNLLFEWLKIKETKGRLGKISGFTIA